MGANQQYAGNQGYDDDVRRAYSYDNTVPNSTQLSRGDLVFVRDGEHLLGLARVISISSSPGKKTRYRCPTCKTTDLKTRAKKLPRFRCSEGHEFDRPFEDVVDVTKYRASYESTFNDAPEMVPVRLLKNAALRRNDQLAIEEIGVDRLLDQLRKAFPQTFVLVSAEATAEPLRGEDALENDNRDETPEDSNEGAGYIHSGEDTRDVVTKQIRARRGQKKFRDALLKRYGPTCQVSGCELLDVLEAAHISPMRGLTDNHPDNGLLLRSDLHTLFDLLLMSIDPDSLKVRLAPSAQAIAPYTELDGKTIRVGTKARPAREPMERHWKSFQALRFGTSESSSDRALGLETKKR